MDEILKFKIATVSVCFEAALMLDRHCVSFTGDGETKLALSAASNHLKKLSLDLNASLDYEWRNPFLEQITKQPTKLQLQRSA